jgi:SAM-dependent methyltransferase
MTEPSADDLRTVEQYWQQRAVECGDDCERIESGQRAQRMRFDVFLDAHDLTGRSVLDVGCGVGDFLGRLKEASVACDYLGVDLAAAMVERARARFADGRFERADILTDPMSRRFDYTVAFAVFNIRVPNGRAILERTLARQFELATRAAHISLLSDRYTAFAEHIQPWHAEDIFAYAMTLTPYVTLRHDYLPHDFSLTLYREPLIDTRDRHE